MGDYAFVHQNKAYTPNQTSVSSSDADAHNAAVEAAELEHWHAKPARFAAYVKINPTLPEKGEVTTWRGVKLGTITRTKTRRNNFGAKIRDVWVCGTNGASYYGCYGDDWATLVRLRRIKG